MKSCIADAALRSLVQRFATQGLLGFTDPASAWAWSLISATDTPTSLMLRTEANRLQPTDPAHLGVGALLSSEDYREREYVQEQVVEWCRRQVFMSAFGAAADHWNGGRYDEAYTVMSRQLEEMNRIVLGGADRGWFFEEFAQRQQRRMLVAQGLDFFPSGIHKIDEAMHGGLSYGELEVPLAYSGIGKTFYLVQRGFICARQRAKCLHLVLEGGRSMIEDRYEARFAQTMYGNVRRGDFESQDMARMRREYALYHQNLVIRGFADQEAWRVSFEDILAELAELREGSGWVPDLILVDYGDLVHAPGKDERERQKTAFRQLKSLSERQAFRGHRGYAVSAPSQAVRPDKAADEKEHILRPRDVADCYEKVRVADALISLNRTLWEKENRRARVSLGKYRDAEDGVVQRIETDYAHGAFSVLSQPEPPPLPPPPKS